MSKTDSNKDKIKNIIQRVTNMLAGFNFGWFLGISLLNLVMIFFLFFQLGYKGLAVELYSVITFSSIIICLFMIFLVINSIINPKKREVKECN